MRHCEPGESLFDPTASEYAFKCRCNHTHGQRAEPRRHRQFVHASNRSPVDRVSSITTQGPAASNSLGVRFRAARSKSVPRSAYWTAGPLVLRNQRHVGPDEPLAAHVIGQYVQMTRGRVGRPWLIPLDVPTRRGG